MIQTIWRFHLLKNLKELVTVKILLLSIVIQAQWKLHKTSFDSMKMFEEDPISIKFDGPCFVWEVLSDSLSEFSVIQKQTIFLDGSSIDDLICQP